MEASFWHQRWSENQIGFHQENVNSRLIRLWPELDITPGAGVFVPLCGKSTDMLWLAEQGYRVLGVELSEPACEAFFQENGLSCRTERRGAFIEFTGDNVRLLAGDFFSLTRADLEEVMAFYDRAALVALPESMRPDYARHMGEILRPGSRGLCISMSYDESRMNGPPFSVTEEEVRRLFAPLFDVDTLARSSGPEIVGNLRERGLDTLDEAVFRMVRHDR